VSSSVLNTLIGENHDEAFLGSTKTPWAFEEGVTSVVRSASARDTSHTTELDPHNVIADTLLLWGTEGEFQLIRWAERFEGDIDSCESVRSDADHRMPENRRKAFRDHLVEFLGGN
jgi:hypothetical protein